MSVETVIDKPILEPRNHATWTAAGFIIGLLALVMTFVGIHNTTTALVVTQMEVAHLDKKIQELSDRVPAPAPAPSVAEQP